VKDKTVQVPRRSHLVLGQAHGLLRQVSSDDDGSLHVSFDGEVSSLRAGATEAATSLVPSILEWVLARNSLFLIWSTSVSVFGLFVAALKRLTRVTA
jgi:hypothetical protein